jgi:hypothetical protein
MLYNDRRMKIWSIFDKLLNYFSDQDLKMTGLKVTERIPRNQHFEKKKHTNPFRKMSTTKYKAYICKMTERIKIFLIFDNMKFTTSFAMWQLVFKAFLTFELVLFFTFMKTKCSCKLLLPITATSHITRRRFLYV